MLFERDIYKEFFVLDAEIKYGALKNLHSFLEVFPTNQRDKMADLYQQLIVLS